MNAKVWIGLVEVSIGPGALVLEEVSGAYVNVLAWVVDGVEFRAKATALMGSLGLTVVGVENAEPLEMRESRDGLGDDVTEVALEMNDNPLAIRYMTFHTWTVKH